jgi:hypothetical protein
LRIKNNNLARAVSITAREIEYLMDCHERIILQHEPPKLSCCAIANKLIRNGLVEAGPYTINGKDIMSVFITKKGKAVLDAYSKS